MLLKSIATSLVLTVAMSASAFAADHAVSIKGFKFDPPMISVAAGDTITFTNEDSAPHTATAKDGSFDTGRLSGGESSTVTISDAGTFDYFCKVHPSMTATVEAK